MFRMFMAFLIVTLIQGTALGAGVKNAKPSKHLPLKNYVLSVEQVKKLNSEQQLNYFAGLIELTALLEIYQVERSLDGGLLAEKAKGKNAEFKWPEIEFGFFPKAEAAIFLVPILWGVGTAVARQLLIRSAPTLLTAARSSISRAMVPVTEKAGQLAVRRGTQLTRVAPKSTSLKTTGSRSLGSPLKREMDGFKGFSGKAGKGAGGKKIGKGTIATVATTAASIGYELAGNKAEADVETYRKDGATCIFGGYISKYKKRGDRFLCSTPPEGRTSTCRGTMSEPLFQCHAFGLQSGPELKNISKETCIKMFSENGLVDLSERCAVAVTTAMEKSMPTRLHTEEYGEFRKQLMAYLDKFEASTAPDSQTNFLQYCEKSNEINQGRQKRECKAITSLIAKLREKLPADVLVAGTPSIIPGAEAADVKANEGAK